MAAKVGKVVNPLDQHLGYLVKRLSAASMAELAERLGELQLRLTEAAILVVIEANPLITQARLGQSLGVQRANMAPIVARLEARSLVEDETLDGRSRGLRLTEEGARLAAAAWARMEQNEERFFGHLPGPERNMLLGRLRQAVAGGVAPGSARPKAAPATRR